MNHFDQLQKPYSDVSLDSDGFPACLKEPASSSTDCRTPLPKGHGEGRIPAFMMQAWKKGCCTSSWGATLGNPDGLLCSRELAKSHGQEKEKERKGLQKARPKDCMPESSCKGKSCSRRGQSGMGELEAHKGTSLAPWQKARKESWLSKSARKGQRIT